jgi:hypothetical protein
VLSKAFLRLAGEKSMSTVRCGRISWMMALLLFALMRRILARGSADGIVLAGLETDYDELRIERWKTLGQSFSFAEIRKDVEVNGWRYCLHKDSRKQRGNGHHYASQVRRWHDPSAWQGVSKPI